MGSCQGTTLIELLAASTIGLVVLVTLGQMDVARVRMYEYIRHGTPPGQPGPSEGGFALNDILGDLKQADRIVLMGTTPASEVLIRSPGDGDLDSGGNYTWTQYTLHGDRILRYDGMRCADPMAYHGVTAFQVQYVGVAGPPVGSEPFASGADNNVVRVTVFSGTRKAWGVATIPAAAYTNVHADCSASYCDSGDGLAGVHWGYPTPCSG